MTAMKKLVIVAAMVASGHAMSQSGEVVMSEGTFSEQHLKDLLRPTVRSIRPRLSDGGGPTGKTRTEELGSQASGPPRASILFTFATNSAELTPRARESLDVLGRALSSVELAEFTFVVEGHADPRGSADLNMRLSQARAESVRRYLVVNHRIASSRLDAIGKGDREILNRGFPAAPENRRVTIINSSLTNEQR